MSWQEIKENYWNTLNSITLTSEVMLVADKYIQDWPSTIFANHPFHYGYSVEDCFQELVDYNRSKYKEFQKPEPDLDMPRES